MTPKELYEWAKENNCETFDLCKIESESGLSIDITVNDLEIDREYKDVVIY